MPGLDPSFSVKKPVSVWNRPLEADYKGLFGALARTALHGATGQWVEAGADLVDGLAALGIEKDAPQLSWLLIRRANLEGANLEGANLEGANLEGTKLEGIWVSLKGSKEKL